jgi:hypothetical protein
MMMRTPLPLPAILKDNDRYQDTGLSTNVEVQR